MFDKRESQVILCVCVCIYVAIVVVQKLYHFAAGMMLLIIAQLLAFSTSSGGQRHLLTTKANVANDHPRGGQLELQPDVCLHLCLDVFLIAVLSFFSFF